MTAHPYYVPSNYPPAPQTPTPLSTPEQAAWRLRAWDAQASDDAAHWCADPYDVGCLSRAAAPARTKQDPWQTYLCPCVHREGAMTDHTHRPDGPARVGVECEACEEAVAETRGTYDEPEVVWTDGVVTGRRGAA